MPLPTKRGGTTAVATTGASNPFRKSVQEVDRQRNAGKEQFRPASEGWHAARIVDQVYRGKEEFQGKVKDSAIYVFALDEMQKDSTGADVPCLVFHYLDPTSYFGGDVARGYQQSKLMEMIRGITGEPRLQKSDLIKRDFVQEDLLGYPFRLEVTHVERGDRVSAVVKSFDEPERTEEGEVKGGPTDQAAPPMSAYKRSEWLKGQEHNPDAETEAMKANADVLAPRTGPRAVPETAGRPSETPGTDADAADVPAPDADDDGSGVDYDPPF